MAITTHTRIRFAIDDALDMVPEVGASCVLSRRTNLPPDYTEYGSCPAADAWAGDHEAEGWTIEMTILEGLAPDPDRRAAR